jgi:hypothetical protein
MERVQHFAQAYRQAPWRRQVQFIGLFLLGLVFIAMVAGVYLNITARASALGRDIQEMQVEIEDIGLENANLQSRLAFLTSSTEMERRALQLGFQRIEMAEPLFLTVDGYRERQAVILAPDPVAVAPVEYTLPAEYTESLFSWLQRELVESPVLRWRVQP